MDFQTRMNKAVERGNRRRDDKLREEADKAFSEEEFGWLERFNRFLELRLDRLSERKTEAREFPIADTWNGIVRDAGNL